MNKIENVDWKNALKKLEAFFGDEMDIQSALFVIGVQELGFVPDRLTKDQKLDVMHVAVCSLLMPYGFYEFIGKDKDGWPHFDRVKKLPPLSEKDQEMLLKNAIIEYVQQF